MTGSDTVFTAIISLCFSCGASLICFHLLSGRRRETARRVAVFVGDLDVHQPVGEGEPRRINLVRALREFAAHPFAPHGVLALLTVAGTIVGIAFGSLPGFATATFGALFLLILSRQDVMRARIERQAPAAVALLAAGLRAGYSVPQAVALVARESPEPTAAQFLRTAQEIELGIGLAEAFARLAQETGSPDYELVSAIVSVQHEAGGNLAQALDAVAETLRERVELREQVNALTAQQRLSSIVLTILPIGLFLFLLATNRAFVDPLLSSLVGRLLLLLVGLLLVAGWVIMRSVGRVEG